MSQFTDIFINFLRGIAEVVPIPVFTFLGALIEEIIAPIPSPIVMTLSGSLAAAANHPVTFLAWLALVGAIGKTIGSWFVYVVSDQLEDVFIDKFGKMLGISHKDTEGFGKFLNKGRKDDIVLFLLRAIPIMPTAPVSVVCGLLKINMRTYLVSTFLGTLVRNAFYLYFGYTSLGSLEKINEGLDQWETVGYVILAALLAGLAYWAIKKKKENDEANWFQKLVDRFLG